MSSLYFLAACATSQASLLLYRFYEVLTVLNAGPTSLAWIVSRHIDHLYSALCHMMKRYCLVALIICSLPLAAQTAAEHYNEAMKQINAHQNEAALREYDIAIRMDSTFVDAYYNRGILKATMDDAVGAAQDFSTAIRLKSDFCNAYINRGFSFLKLDQLSNARADFNKAISLDSTRSNAFVGRGQVSMRENDFDAACKDLTKARKLGDKRVDPLLLKYCSSDKPVLPKAKKNESLVLDWPESEGWHVTNKEDGADVLMMEVLRNNESFQNWSEIGTMFVYKKVSASFEIPITLTMETMFKSAQKSCPSAKLSFIDKDEHAQFPWIIFKIECASDTGAESQVWHAVQGSEHLYVNFRAVKQPTVPAALQEQWTQFFKSARVLVQE